MKIRRQTYELVADYFINVANVTGSLITNMKLQKLVYYSQAWHLALYNEPLFEEEFEAWVHGPVLPALYGEYKYKKWSPINKEVNLSDIKSLGDEKLRFLYDVEKTYFDLDAYELEELTHSETPWIEARGNLANNEPCKNKIKKETMKTFYAQLH